MSWVWVHYLTKGIEQDFGRTWEEPPTSIRPKLTGLAKKAKGGKRIISKKKRMTRSHNFLGDTGNQKLRVGHYHKKKHLLFQDAIAKKAEEENLVLMRTRRPPALVSMMVKRGSKLFW